MIAVITSGSSVVRIRYRRCAQSVNLLTGIHREKANNMKRLRLKQEDELAECKSCRYPAPLKLYSYPFGHLLYNGGKKHLPLCEICAGSLISNYTAFYTAYSSEAVISASSAAFCANAVLDQLGAFDGAPLQTYESLENED